MALIKCPECGKESVSDTAVACPGCGYNIQAYTEYKNLEAERTRKREEARLREERETARKSTPAYRKKKQIITLFAVIGIIASIVYVIAATKIRENESYEKDLSSIFKISLGASVEDVIKFEAEEFGHTEYETQYYEGSDDFRLTFISSIVVDERHGKHDWHRYEFNSNKELKFIWYGLGTSVCKHAEEIKHRALKVSPYWDKESDHVQLIMNGQINGVRCHVIYYDYYISEICLRYAQ